MLPELVPGCELVSGEGAGEGPDVKSTFEENHNLKITIWVQGSYSARVRAKMKPFVDPRIFKRRIDYIKKVSDPAHLKSTKIAVFGSIWKWNLVNGHMLS